MYGESGLALQFMQDCSQETHQFEEDLFKSYNLSYEMENLVETCVYDFGEESSDLIKASEQEPMLAFDPFSQEILELDDLGSLHSDQQLIDKAFQDCEQDILVRSAMEPTPYEALDIKNISLVSKTESVISGGSVVVSDVQVPKSVSSGNLCSMIMSQHEDATAVQSFPGFFSVDYGMRRAFSESDIQTLGTRNVSEERREKLSRYRNKKSKRNFGRKIKYACRKALADNQPRIRGRFAKNRDAKNDDDLVSSLI
ncbi:unnamed protein product [Cochlearia groenlandica]